MRIKPVFVSLMIFTAFTIPAAGQIEFPTPDEIINMIFNYDYPAVEKETRFLTIRGQELDTLPARRLDEYKNLEAVTIEFTENPEAPDSVKEKLIADIEKKLPYLACLKKCPGLKYVIFHAGVYLFIRSVDKLPYNSGSSSIDIKADRLNLERLNSRFGKKLTEILPGIKIYAHNWGW